MSTTRDMMRRADRMKGDRVRRQPTDKQPGFQPVCPMPAVSEDAEPPVPDAPVRMAVPQPIKENSVYRQLMRSHDRVHTRHLKG